MNPLENVCEKICGSEFWNNETVYSDYPDFTFCFQNTILIWIPCAVLWIISPLWVYMLTRQVTPRIPLFSWVFIVKIAITACLAAIEVSHLYKAFVTEKKELVFYLTPVIVIMTYILAIFLTNFERIRGLKTSSLLFAYWTLTFLISIIRLRTAIIDFGELDGSYQVQTDVEFWIFNLYFGLLTINTIFSVVSLPVQQFRDDGTYKILPENHVSLLSKLWFWWINNLILTGYKRDLVKEDLWKIEDTESSDYNSERFEDHWLKKAVLYIEYLRANPEVRDALEFQKQKKTRKDKNGPSSLGREPG
jgi:ATP-binding cassette subfamily C (CFTR/MRP) protein 1